MNASTVLIIGAVGPQRGQNSSWEIAVNRKAEYSKLPHSRFPSTVGTNPCGIGVTLRHAGNSCEASLHRALRGNFYIGSAKSRLDSRYTSLYDAFLRNSGFMIAGKTVKLTFCGRMVWLS